MEGRPPSGTVSCPGLPYRKTWTPPTSRKQARPPGQAANDCPCGFSQERAQRGPQGGRVGEPAALCVPTSLCAAPRPCKARAWSHLGTLAARRSPAGEKGKWGGRGQGHLPDGKGLPAPRLENLPAKAHRLGSTLLVTPRPLGWVRPPGAQVRQNFLPASPTLHHFSLGIEPGVSMLSHPPPPRILLSCPGLT